jgi:hypothetical protein
MTDSFCMHVTNGLNLRNGVCINFAIFWFFVVLIVNTIVNNTSVLDDELPSQFNPYRGCCIIIIDTWSLWIFFFFKFQPLTAGPGNVFVRFLHPFKCLGLFAHENKLKIQRMSCMTIVRISFDENICSEFKVVSLVLTARKEKIIMFHILSQLITSGYKFLHL